MKKSSLKITLLIVLLVSMIFPSCKKNDGKSTNENAETLTVNGVAREYIRYIPFSYDGSNDVPLMLNFHGFGMTATNQMNIADMRSLADLENFILVYPQGTLLDGSPHWNSGLDTPDNKSDAEDLDFIEALIDELSSNYSIDLERVYACGYSNGSFFSYALGCYLSHKIAAIGSVSGTMMEETLNNCNPTHPTAMINLHGTSDNTVLYNGGEGLEAIDDVMNYWANYNNTNTTPVTNTENNIEYFSYNNGTAGVSVEHYKINGGEHVWFDIDYQGSNTNQLIWNFVSQYDINGLIQ